MSTYKRFEDLPVWKAAIDLGLKVFALTDHNAFDYQGDLRSQLRRAALSISNNIAEGFERGTTNELLTFLYIARGSAGEVRSMLCFAERLERISTATTRSTEDSAAGKSGGRSTTSKSHPLRPQSHSHSHSHTHSHSHSHSHSESSNLKSQISDLKSHISDLKSLAESCSRQLRAWADALQNSDIKGQRHLSDAAQSVFTRTQRSAAFLEKLQHVREYGVSVNG